MKQNNSLERRPYWVKRVPVWGGSWAFVILGRNEKGVVEEVGQSGIEAIALKRCLKLNDDHERFVNHRLEKLK
jgi:hypothetical protein